MPQARRPRTPTLVPEPGVGRIDGTAADRTKQAVTIDHGRRVDMCEVRCIDAPAVSRVRNEMPTATQVERAAERLKLLGDPTRLRLLTALARADELCVCDLTLIVSAGGASAVTESAVSHALRGLRLSGLVTFRKVQKIAYYRLADADARKLVADLFGWPNQSGSQATAAGRTA